MSKYAAITGWGMAVPERVLTNAETSLFEWRNAVADLKLVDSAGRAIRIATGPVTVSAQVTA